MGIQGQRMDDNAIVPFRLSPALAKFTTICQSRHALLEAIEAASSSILHNQFTIMGITRGILRDEELKRKTDFEELEMESMQLTSLIKTRSQVIINNLNKINKDAAKVTNEAMSTQ